MKVSSVIAGTIAACSVGAAIAAGNIVGGHQMDSCDSWSCKKGNYYIVPDDWKGDPLLFNGGPKTLVKLRCRKTQ